MGEYSGARSWYRGDPPARLPLPVLVGDPDCILNGESPGLPIIPDASPFCGKILPDPCYSVESEIIARTNVLDCVFGKNSADIIGLAYTDLAAAESAVQDLLGPTATVSSFPQPTPLVSAGVIAIIGTTAVIWLTGTTNFQQLALQAFYFGFGPINQGFYSTSAIDEAAAVAIAGQMALAGVDPLGRIVFAGHSFGGAVCMVLAAKMRVANPTCNVELLSFGAPKPGDQRLIDLTTALLQVHYADERDPIPYMPPRGVTFAALVPFLGPVLSLFWPMFARVPIVKTVTRDGQFIDERTADLPEDLMFAASLAIAAGLDAPAFKDHLIEWYAFYLCQACKCVPRPCVEPPIPVVGFSVELDALAFDQGSGPEVLTIPASVLIPVGFFPDGKVQTWTVLVAGVGRITIEATEDLAGNYTAFRVTTDPDPTPPTWLCFWDFSLVEMQAGIDTSDPPDSFADTFISLNSLVVVPSFL